MRSHWNHRGGGLWLRLTFIFAATTVAILAAVTFAFSRWDSGREDALKGLETNVVQYTDFLISELGTPPEQKKIMQWSEKLGLGIRVESKTKGLLLSSPELPGVSNLPTRSFLLLGSRQQTTGRYGWWQHRIFLVREAGDSTFIFFSPSPRAGAFAHRVGWILAGLALLMLMGFIATRMSMGPVDTLLRGVEKLSQGNLEFRLRSHGSHEFRRIADGFNTMAASLQNMVKSRERLLQDVSHELRSPLARIRMAVELSQDALLRSRVGQEVKEMDALIGELLEMGRLEATGRPETVDLLGLLREVCQKFSSAGRAVILSTEPHDLSSAIVSGSDRDIRKLFGNLIDNALKYSGGEVHVILCASAAGREYRVDVRDSGIGIAPENHVRIFEAFARVDSSRSRETGGFGLGLSLAQRVAQAHAGRITLQSALGKGSVFSVHLPASAPNPNQS